MRPAPMMAMESGDVGVLMTAPPGLSVMLPCRVSDFTWCNSDASTTLHPVQWSTAPGARTGLDSGYGQMEAGRAWPARRGGGDAVHRAGIRRGDRGGYRRARRPDETLVLQ